MDIAEIAAVSALKIFSLILSGVTPSKEKISFLSGSEKSPSGPIIMHIGLFDNFFNSFVVYFSHDCTISNNR